MDADGPPGLNPPLSASPQDRAMAIWSFCIAASVEGPDEGSGFVRAETVEEALGLVGHPETNLYPCHDDVEMPEGAAVWFEEPGRGGRGAATS